MNNSKKNTDKTSENYIAIESFGVRLSIYAHRRDLLAEIERRLPSVIPAELYREVAPRCAAHRFSIRRNRTAEYVLFNGRKKITGGNDREIFLKFFDSKIRLTVAEHAVGRVFVHAGVVEWQGKAIIFPAHSFQGKTTLIKELTKLGAKYYSDEYAVLDERGYVHPFPKMLSIRGLVDEYQQIDFPVEKFGGTRGIKPLAVGMIVLTEFEPGSEWHPQILSAGFGVLEMLSHAIPIRYNPKFTLKVLNKTANRAIIIKTKRGEAIDFALKVLSFFENGAF